MESAMNYFVFLVLALNIFFCEDVFAKKHNKRHRHSKSGNKIVGGYETTIQDYPYQVFLLLTKQPEDYYQCGGSIISTWYILSAAHCFPDVTEVKARIGSTDKFSGGQEYPAESFTTHPQYNHITKDYDIAYVKTQTEMVLDGVNAKAISLIEPGMSIPSGSIAKLSGWGATSEGGDSSNTLRAVEVPTLSNEECNQKETVTIRQFCGGYDEGGKDTCQGDSGGPVVIQETGLLSGVVSAGWGCARPGKPGIYTNLTELSSWVTQETGV